MIRSNRIIWILIRDSIRFDSIVSLNNSASSDRRKMRRSSLEPPRRAASNGGGFILLRPLDAEIFVETVELNRITNQIQMIQFKSESNFNDLRFNRIEFKFDLIRFVWNTIIYLKYNQRYIIKFYFFKKYLIIILQFSIITKNANYSTSIHLNLIKINI